MGRVQYETDDQIGGSLLGDLGKSIFKSIGNSVVDGITSSGKDLVGSLGDKAKTKLFGSGVKHSAKNHPHSKMGRVEYQTDDDQEGGYYNRYHAHATINKGQTREQLKTSYHAARDARKGEHKAYWDQLGHAAESYYDDHDRPTVFLPAALDAYQKFRAMWKEHGGQEYASSENKNKFVSGKWKANQYPLGADADEVEKIKLIRRTIKPKKEKKGKGLFMP